MAPFMMPSQIMDAAVQVIFLNQIQILYVVRANFIHLRIIFNVVEKGKLLGYFLFLLREEAGYFEDEGIYFKSFINSVVTFYAPKPIYCITQHATVQL